MFIIIRCKSSKSFPIDCNDTITYFYTTLSCNWITIDKSLYNGICWIKQLTIVTLNHARRYLINIRCEVRCEYGIEEVYCKCSVFHTHIHYSTDCTQRTIFVPGVMSTLAYKQHQNVRYVYFYRNHTLHHALLSKSLQHANYRSNRHNITYHHISTYLIKIF